MRKHDSCCLRERKYSNLKRQNCIKTYKSSHYIDLYGVKLTRRKGDGRGKTPTSPPGQFTSAHHSPLPPPPPPPHHLPPWMNPTQRVGPGYLAWRTSLSLSHLAPRCTRKHRPTHNTCGSGEATPNNQRGRENNRLARWKKNKQQAEDA